MSLCWYNYEEDHDGIGSLTWAKISHERGLFKEHFCGLILNSDHWRGRRCRLKFCSYFTAGVHFVRQSDNI